MVKCEVCHKNVKEVFQCTDKDKGEYWACYDCAPSRFRTKFDGSKEVINHKGGRWGDGDAMRW